MGLNNSRLVFFAVGKVGVLLFVVGRAFAGGLAGGLALAGDATALVALECLGCAGGGVFGGLGIFGGGALVGLETLGCAGGGVLGCLGILGGDALVGLETLDCAGGGVLGCLGFLGGGALGCLERLG